MCHVLFNTASSTNAHESPLSQLVFLIHHKKIQHWPEPTELHVHVGFWCKLCKWQRLTVKMSSFKYNLFWQEGISRQKVQNSPTLCHSHIGFHNFLQNNTKKTVNIKWWIAQIMVKTCYIEHTWDMWVIKPLNKCNSNSKLHCWVWA